MTGGWRIAACGVLWIALAQPPAAEVPPLIDAEVGAALACGADPACRIPEVPFGGRWLVVTQGSITTNAGYISQLARQAQQRHATLALKDVSSRLRFRAWVVTATGQAPTRVNFAAVQSFDRVLLFAAGPQGKPLETPLAPHYTERTPPRLGQRGEPDHDPVDRRLLRPGRHSGGRLLRGHDRDPDAVAPDQPRQPGEGRTRALGTSVPSPWFAT